jgi:hypothetical protein
LSLLQWLSRLNEQGAIDFCTRSFHVIDLKRRSRAQKSPELFRFDATRLYGFIDAPEGIQERAVRSIFTVKFEIQIRTAFEHAWIISTHPLTYKSDNIDWKRFRLSAQLKAAAEQLDLAIVHFEELAAAISESPWPDIQQKREIVDLIERLSRKRIIPTEAGPKDMSRFADNLMALLRASKKKIRVEQAMFRA